MDHHAGQPHQPQQQLAFTFPTPEEMALHQRLAMQMALGPGAVAVSEPFPGVLQPGGYHSGPLSARLHPSLNMEALSHLRPEEQATVLAQIQAQAPQFFQGMVSGPVMEQLLAQQQQQQQQQQVMAAAAAVAAGIGPGGIGPGGIGPGGIGPGIVPTTPENLLEHQRQYEILIQSVQKNPALLQNMQVHLAIEQYQRFFEQVQLQRMQEAMLQTSQQHELHKNLLARLPGTSAEEVQPVRGIRPGVIVHPN